MRELATMIPDVEQLLALEPEELAAKMLLIFQRRASRPGGGANSSMFVVTNVLNEITPELYGMAAMESVSQAVVEAWSWLEAQGLLVRHPNRAGDHGWRVLSRRAAKFTDDAEVHRFAVARQLSREALHLSIRQVVWAAFMRGEYDVAAFQAMKAVEVAVRTSSGLDGLLGYDLMRQAFHPERGPLTDQEAHAGERQSRADLFAGAIGSFKNPHSHRDVHLDDPTEAIEIIMLANHLLRIVDARKPAAAAASGP